MSVSGRKWRRSRFRSKSSGFQKAWLTGLLQRLHTASRCQHLFGLRSLQCMMSSAGFGWRPGPQGREMAIHQTVYVTEKSRMQHSTGLVVRTP